MYVALQTTVLGLFAWVFLKCQWVQTYHSIHSKIPLTWHPWNWTGTRLLDIIIHNLKWPQFLQIIFCYCSYTLDVQLLRVFHRGLSPSADSGPSKYSFAFYAVFIAEGIDGVGDKGWVSTPVNDDIFRGLFEYVPDVCLFHQCLFSSKQAKLQRSQSLEYSTWVPD